VFCPHFITGSFLLTDRVQHRHPKQCPPATPLHGKRNGDAEHIKRFNAAADEYARFNCILETNGAHANSRFNRMLRNEIPVI